MNSTLQRRQFSFLALIFQAIFVVLFGMFGCYDSSTTTQVSANNNQIQNYYPSTKILFFLKKSFFNNFSFSRYSCYGYYWFWIFNVFS